MKLRNATLDDVPAIWELINTSFQGPHSQYIATGQRGFKNYLRDQIDSREQGPKKLLVATVDGVFAAFVDMILGNPGPNFLTRIGVAESFRGQGIAKRLLKVVNKEYTSGNGWQLDVMADNQAAITLYKNLGFSVISSKKWIGRLLPAEELFAMIPQQRNAPSDPQYARYGFTKLPWGNKEVAISGGAIRCNSIHQFLDNNQLAGIKGIFPTVDRAFIIVNAEEHCLDNYPATFEISRSHRMSGTL